jgi:protein-tyrosine phosphatase
MLVTRSISWGDSSMEWIDDMVAVGNWVDASGVDDLKREEIDLIVDARTLFKQNKLGSNRVPLVKKVLRAADLLVAVSDHKPKVMIRCHRGRDRSPFVAMVYVSKKYGISHKEAYDMVRKKNPRTVYHWDWVEMLGDVGT